MAKRIKTKPISKISFSADRKHAYCLVRDAYWEEIGLDWAIQFIASGRGIEVQA